MLGGAVMYANGETPKDFALNTAHQFATQDCVCPVLQSCTQRLTVLIGKWCTTDICRLCNIVL